MKPARISIYGHFGDGNLGNECTLQAVIEQILRRLPEAQLQCFCTNPEDVRTRHKINAIPSVAINRYGRSVRRGPLMRVLRILRWIPLELVHWIRCLRAIGRADMLVIAGTGIIQDYMCGPFGWPYDIFKLSTLAALCRVKIVFICVGAGPIYHPLSRWLLKTSLALAYHRSYRDEASKQYLHKIGFDTDRDFVYPDVVFGLSQSNFTVGRSGERRVVGLGIKDYGSAERLGTKALQEYLDTMAAFVSWLQTRGCTVRLIVGDFRFDTSVIEQFIGVLKSHNIATDAPLLIAEPALTVDELLRQIGETETVVSARYHNLVMALIQDKPVIALSDHPKLDSVVTDIGLAKYLLPLQNLSRDALVGSFTELEKDAEQIKPHLKAELEKNRQALEALFATLFAKPSVAA